MIFNCNTQGFLNHSNNNYNKTWRKSKGSSVVEGIAAEKGPTHLNQLNANYTSLESATH